MELGITQRQVHGFKNIWEGKYMFEQYEHHGVMVWVDSDLKGKHRDICLCFKCKKFSFVREENCATANLLYALDVKLNLTTPVFECPEFEVLDRWKDQ